MKKQINEIRRMQQLAGLNENTGMMGGMHGEEDFMSSIMDIITKKYASLIASRDYDALGAAIEKDYPMLRSDLILQNIFGNDTPEELSTPPNE